MEFLFLLAWFIRYLIFTLGLLVGITTWLLYSYDSRRERPPELCPCVSAEWDSLDSRWKKFLSAFDCLVYNPNATTISATIATAGNVAAWLFGRRAFRSPADDAWLEYTTKNFESYGCAMGERSLVSVVKVGPGGTTSLAEAVHIKVCPGVATNSPFRYIRSEAIANLTMTSR